MKKTITLKKNYEFRKVLSKGASFFGKNIIAFIQKDNQQKENFLGIAISAKICKAVTRNHIKRLIRESYYIYEEQITKGNKIVFLWNKKADPKKICFQDIKNDMEKIFKQANIL